LLEPLTVSNYKHKFDNSKLFGTEHHEIAADCTEERKEGTVWRSTTAIATATFDILSNGSY